MEGTIQRQEVGVKAAAGVGAGAQIQLTKRDREILRLCYEQQIVSIRQVAGHFYGGEYRNAATRIRKLRGMGLVRWTTLCSTERSSIFALTRRGVAEVRREAMLEIPQRKRFSDLTLAHDLLVTDVRLRLARFWDAAWLPERALRAEEYPRVPDGVLLFRSGKKVAVEVERTLKSLKRYERLWRQWQKTQTALVFHVAGSPGVETFLKKYLPRLAPQEVTFGVVSWAALCSGEPLIWTTRGEYPLLRKREF